MIWLFRKLTELKLKLEITPMSNDYTRTEIKITNLQNGKSIDYIEHNFRFPSEDLLIWWIEQSYTHLK